MTFLNGLLAFGAAAFTIPLLIHLLHRNRYVTLDWGAMHLLQFSRSVNAKRVQWQQLLLLFLRCLLPILLALAMSRPL
ncbi:MAG: BatA domain-containing protein, partial [Pirellula staleyi]